MADIEIVDIEEENIVVSNADSNDSPKDILNVSLDDKQKNYRRVANSGSKAPHKAINFRPIRKTPQPQPPPKVSSHRMSTRSSTRGNNKQKQNKNVECYDIDDDEDDEEEESDDEDIQILDDDEDNELEEITLGGEVASDDFCDLCGLYLNSSSELEKHHETVHKVVMCKWCEKRVTLSRINSHIKSKCSKFVKILGSHCSIHNMMETDEQLLLEDYQSCRPWRCHACAQRYDKNSLVESAGSIDSFVCPGCLHGKVTNINNVTETEHDVEEINLEEEVNPLETRNVDIDKEISSEVNLVEEVNPLMIELVSIEKESSPNNDKKSSETVKNLCGEIVQEIISNATSNILESGAQDKNSNVEDSDKCNEIQIVEDKGMSNDEPAQDKNAADFTMGEVNDKDDPQLETSIVLLDGNQLEKVSEAEEEIEKSPEKLPDENPTPKIVSLDNSISNQEPESESSVVQIMDVSQLEEEVTIVENFDNNVATVEKAFETSRIEIMEITSTEDDVAVVENIDKDVQEVEVTRVENNVKDHQVLEVEIEELEFVQNVDKEVKDTDVLPNKETEEVQSVDNSVIQLEEVPNQEVTVDDSICEVEKAPSPVKPKNSDLFVHCSFIDDKQNEVTDSPKSNNKITKDNDKCAPEADLREVQIEDFQSIFETASQKDESLTQKVAESQTNNDSVMEVVTLDDNVEPVKSHKIVTLDDEDINIVTPTTSLKKPERRVGVARKSTRPPQNPQRDTQENPNSQSVSPGNLGKRKLESESTSPKKVARKSTKPPAFPQVIEMMFIDETSNDASDPVTKKKDDLNSSILLMSPNRDDTEDEIEEITIC